MKRCYPTRVVLYLLLILAVALSGCGQGGENGDGSGAKNADPFPMQKATDISQWSDRTFQPTNETEYNSLINYMNEITGNSDNETWPDCAIQAVAYAALCYSTWGGHLLVTQHEYKMVSDVLFFEYTNWYQPNTTLSMTLSDINETSVSNSLSTSVGLSLGYEPFGTLSASITLESSKTVTIAKGIEVNTTYDLTQYDQSKLYKVVLAGNYICVRYHFRVIHNNPSQLPPQYNTDGSGYIGYFEIIKVRQDSLTVKLVHN